MISTVIEILLKHEHSKDPIGIRWKVCMKHSLKLLVFAAVMLIVMFLLPTDIKSSEHFSVLFVLASVAIYIIYGLATGDSDTKAMIRPTEGYFLTLQKTMESEYALINELMTIEVHQLELALKRLQHNREIITSRMGFYFGPMNKLAIIPVIAAVAMVLHKMIGLPSLSFSDAILYLFSVFALGVYIGCMQVGHVAHKLDGTIFAVKTAIEHIQQSSTLGSGN